MVDGGEIARTASDQQAVLRQAMYSYELQNIGLSVHLKKP